jgi:uncharacterized protein (DUF1684 family)
MQQKTGALILISIAAVAGLYFLEKRKNNQMVKPEYSTEIKKFRDEAESRLRSSDGWLSLVGLHWLKKGHNIVGSDLKSSVVLPASVPAHLADIHLDNAATIIFKSELKNSKVIFIDGKPIGSKLNYDLLDDVAPKEATTPNTIKSEKMRPTKIQAGSVQFYLINRPNGIGVRVKDALSEHIKNFKGRQWYPIKGDYKIKALWQPNDGSLKIKIPDVLGNLTEEVIPGIAKFEIDGEKIELYPIIDGEELFFIFRDQTSGKETYGAARFLYADKPSNGFVTLDFNKAINPPCAFTHFATCPLPPPQNILKVAIRAGELKPAGHY